MRWFLITIAITACADSTKPPASAAQNNTRVVDGVEVTVLPNAPPNPMCLSYCKSFGACWLNLSNTDPMVSSDTAEKRCLLEQSSCQRQTADLHCCAKLSDCGEFAHCIETAHNVVSDCDRFPSEPTASGR